MHTAALDVNFCRRRIEIFILQLANFAAAHGVGKIRAKTGDIESIRAVANFFIRCKANFNHAVLDLAMGCQIFQGCHDFSQTSLVIRAEQGGAVGGNEGLTDIFIQVREFTRGKNDVLLMVEDDIPAVVLNELRFDVFTSQVGAGIHVRHEADNRSGGSGVGWQGAINVATRIHEDVNQTKVLQFLNQQTRQVELAGSGGEGS